MSSVPEEARVTVSSYRITSNTVFDESTLLALIADRTGILSLEELSKIADEVAMHYRNHGYLLTLAYQYGRCSLCRGLGGSATLAVLARTDRWRRA